MIQRGGQVVINLLANVKQKTIEPFITDTIVAGTRVHTDEYSIYARLQSWGYGHKSVNHGRGECARDEDGDGFCEVHVNTMESFWSLLRSWLRPHRGISQEKLPLYLGFFEFVHNVRRQQFPEESKPQYSSRCPVWLFVNLYAIMRPSYPLCRSLHVGGGDGNPCSYSA